MLLCILTIFSYSIFLIITLLLTVTKNNSVISIEIDNNNICTTIYSTLLSTVGTSTPSSSAIAILVESILGNKQLYYNHNEYTNLLQYHMLPFKSDLTKYLNKIFEFKSHYYKTIYKLADILKKLHKVKK